MRNAPNSTVLTVDKGLRSFLVRMKPNFRRVELFKGCGSTICDGFHSGLDNIKCPSIGNVKKPSYVMSCMIKVGDLPPVKVTSKALAKFFIAPGAYEVSV